MWKIREKNIPKKKSHIKMIHINHKLMDKNFK